MRFNFELSDCNHLPVENWTFIIEHERKFLLLCLLKTSHQFILLDVAFAAINQAVT